MTRTLSFWGWGWDDRFPTHDERRRMGQMLAALLGAPEPTPRDQPTLETITMPEARLTLPAPLTEYCTTDRYERARHTYGRGYPDLVRGFQGDFSAAPDWVALPKTEDHITAVLDWAANNNAAVIPFGGGTSVVAGIEADVPDRYQGVISLDLRNLNRLLSVDQTSLTAHLQAGATGPQVEAQLAEHGLTLRHFPQSFEFSTLGGWIATRAGGHFATLYTHIDDLVASVRMLTPTGVLETPLWPASGAGPDPNSLVCGSEGTLGIITEAHMRVRQRPRWRSKASVRFDDFQKAVAATRALAQSNLYPANCRLLDAREAMLHGVAPGTFHVLLLGFESASEPTQLWMERAVAIAQDAGGVLTAEPRHSDNSTADDDRAGSSWRQAFLEAPYRFNSLVSLGVVVDTFETACTWTGFEAMHKAIVRNVKQAMLKATGSKGWISCRFTHVYPDGPAPYYTFIAPGTPGKELEQWRAIKTAASETLLEHGGTITHHHAVGRLHKPWYQRQSPEVFTRVLRAAKAELDPSAVLNPGVLFDTEG